MAQLVKNTPAVWETWFLSLGWEDTLKGKGHPLHYSGLENSMDSISPWGQKESDRTERLSLSLSGSSVPGIPQAKVLEWVAIFSSKGSSQPSDRTQVSSVSYIGRQVLYHKSQLG